MSSLLIVVILMSIPIAVCIGNEISEYLELKKEVIKENIKLKEKGVQLKIVIERNKQQLQDARDMINNHRL